MSHIVAVNTNEHVQRQTGIFPLKTLFLFCFHNNKTHKSNHLQYPNSKFANYVTSTPQPWRYLPMCIPLCVIVHEIMSTLYAGCKYVWGFFVDHSARWYISMAFVESFYDLEFVFISSVSAGSHLPLVSICIIRSRYEWRSNHSNIPWHTWRNVHLTTIWEQIFLFSHLVVVLRRINTKSKSLIS